jgi:hypothetical protein
MNPSAEFGLLFLSDYHFIRGCLRSPSQPELDGLTSKSGVLETRDDTNVAFPTPPLAGR